jgi:hypothetical protein
VEPLFVGPKSLRVVLAPALYQASGMFDMKHFVEKDELDKPLGHVRCIQGFADGDGLVDWVVMAQNVPRAPL